LVFPEWCCGCHGSPANHCQARPSLASARYPSAQWLRAQGFIVAPIRNDHSLRDVFKQANGAPVHSTVGGLIGGILLYILVCEYASANVVKVGEL